MPSNPENDSLEHGEHVFGVEALEPFQHNEGTGCFENVLQIDSVLGSSERARNSPALKVLHVRVVMNQELLHDVPQADIVCPRIRILIITSLTRIWCLSTDVKTNRGRGSSDATPSSLQEQTKHRVCRC